jgi:GNAT superfamily N-acetyltransferase
MSRMGFFNPHAVDFILNALRYLAHWWRHYALTRRSLVVPWFVGSLVVMAKLVRMKSRLLKPPPDLAERAARVARDNDVPPAALESLSRLQQPPITQRFFRIIREFWIDRVVIALVMTGGTVALALVPIPLWIKLMVPLSSFPLLYLVYEFLIREEGVHAIGSGIPAVARQIGDVLPVRVVTFGHSHRPRLVPLRGGLTFVDTGTWAPITKMDDRRRTPGYRNYLVAAFDGDRTVVRLECWDPVRPKVRVARGKADRALCRSVRRAAFVEDPGEASGETRTSTDAAVTHFLAFVAYRVAAGTATLRDLGDGVGRIDLLAVVPTRRRLGVGRALAGAVEAEARGRCLREIVVNVPIDAVPFFEAVGYEPGGETSHGLHESRRILRRSL